MSGKTTKSIVSLFAKSMMKPIHWFECKMGCHESTTHNNESAYTLTFVCDHCGHTEEFNYEVIVKALDKVNELKNG